MARFSRLRVKHVSVWLTLQSIWFWNHFWFCRSPMWSASRQVVPPVGSMEFAHLDTSFKKSTQTFNQSGRRSPPSSYCENPSTSSYSARKMSPSFQRFTSETYLPSGTPVPEDNYSRVALGRTYLQNSARCSLSERFKMFDPVESFHYDEKITIGIHCGIQGPPGSPRPVRHEFNPYNFIMVRQKNEGSRPIFDREELRQYCYDETEEDPDDYRVVTVAPTDRDDYMQVGATDSSYNVGYRSPPRPGGPPSYQWNEDQYGYNRSVVQRQLIFCSVCSFYFLFFFFFFFFFSNL